MKKRKLTVIETQLEKKKGAHINQTVVECLVKIYESWRKKFYEFGRTRVKLFPNLTSILLDYI